MSQCPFGNELREVPGTERDRNDAQGCRNIELDVDDSHVEGQEKESSNNQEGEEIQGQYGSEIMKELKTRKGCRLVHGRRNHADAMLQQKLRLGHIR